MKLIRNLQKNNLSRLFLPALAVLFVFSLSFHNHGIGEHPHYSFESQSHANHSLEDCSACLLQGSLQIPQAAKYFDTSYLGHIIATLSIDLVVPNSYLNIDKPSRAPPTI